MRLIDADAFDKCLENAEAEAIHMRKHVFASAVNVIRGNLRSFPTIEERKKGKWIPHSEKSREYIGTVLVNVEYDYWLCDACGYRVENGQPMYKFCPNCGADMRGKTDE